MPEMAEFLTATAAMLSGGAAASGWTAAVIVANTAFDGLDHGRADRMLRKVLVATASFQAALMAIAGGVALLAGATAAGIVALVAALGFFSNIWTLAPRRDKAPTGVRRKNSTMRVVAVSLTLIMTLAALAAGIMAVVGV